MHVEDHPLEYATFEGEIPAGEYGAGSVEIWDTGTYELVERKRDGGLTVQLHGSRLKGQWTLIPAHMDGDPKNWLLVRKDGSETGDGRVPKPMLAKLADAPPEGEGWLHEVKLDGFRAIATVRAGEATLQQPERQRPDRAVRRGRARAPGRASERRLRPRRRGVRARSRRPCQASGCSSAGAGSLVVYLFDILELDGEDLTAPPPRRPAGAPRADARPRTTRRAALGRL